MSTLDSATNMASTSESTSKPGEESTIEPGEAVSTREIGISTRPETPFQIITHQGNPAFSREVAQRLDKESVETGYRHFADGELCFRLEDNVREHNVYVVYSLGADINRDIMELMLLADTLNRSSANKINLVMPYYPYCRQDRKCVGREPISASALAVMLQKAGYYRITTMDLHNGSIQGFGDCVRLDNLSAEPLFCKYIKEVIIDRYLKIKKEEYDQLREKLVIVSPDEGGTKRTSHFLHRLNNYLDLPKEHRLEMVTMIKKRGKDGDVSVMESNVPVPGKICVLLDDIIDSGGTLMKAVSVLKKSREIDVSSYFPEGTSLPEGGRVTVPGADKVFAMVTHALLNDKPPHGDKPGTIATELLKNPDLEEIVVTNSVYLGDKPKLCPKIRVLDVTEMFAQAIEFNQQSSSTQSLFHPEHYLRPIDWYLRYSGKSALPTPDHPHLASSESENNLQAMRKMHLSPELIEDEEVTDSEEGVSLLSQLRN